MCVQELKKATCRVDWHQTGSMVVVSFYAKACLPEKSFVEANPTNVRRWQGSLVARRVRWQGSLVARGVIGPGARGRDSHPT